MDEVLAQRGVIGIGDAEAQDGEDLIIDLVCPRWRRVLMLVLLISPAVAKFRGWCAGG